MSIILGFGGKETKLVKTTESPYVADLFGMTTIYVYCDIVQPQFVRDTSAKLLRSIPVEGKSGEVITKTFINMQYVPVPTKSFEDIEILLRDDTGNPIIHDNSLQTAQLLYLKMNNLYVRYYLDQQQGHGMSVFRGSPWQMGHGQMGYGLGGLFHSVARAVMPMVKSGAKALGNIALNSGANFVGDVLAGKNVKEAAKAQAIEAANVAKRKAVNRLQTGSGKRTTQARVRKRVNKQTGKKRKASMSAVRSTQTKKRRTVPQDIFG